ncbi:MAG TPA: phosphonatase-like hydrolase [Vicinamibacterales bacterium]|nr:phosphonatase-like hydrolase [Vicinamibacterales bacterium]
MTLPALVVLDMAGTTIEDRGQVPTAFAETLAANGISITADEITRVRGASKRQAIRDLLQHSEPEACRDEASAQTADRIYDEFRTNLSNAYRTGGVRSVPDAAEVMVFLRSKGVKVALTTGFDRDVATLLLSTLGWTRNTVDAVVCGDDVANGRPAPDLILMAMKLTGIEDAARVANVGDTTLDLESASRAGVRWNIGVLTGAHTREALERAPHTEIIPSIADLRF